jgi:uncharacterized membrane protein YraQ (UPF0718 family)
MSGAARYINRALQSRPFVAILLATIVGAFSPFCSCGVIPVIAALLMGGVPLAPVMTFWIASPSMDPEIFFLSVATLGWDLAVWRLASTLILSLTAGFMTHFLVQQGWLGQNVLRSHRIPSVQSRLDLVNRGLLSIKNNWQKFKERLDVSFSQQRIIAPSAAQAACCAAATPIDNYQIITPPSVPASSCGSSYQTTEERPPVCGRSCGSQSASFLRRLFTETWKATAMVVKFMALAFFLKALISLYIPAEWIAGLLGHENPFAIFTAALIGIPVYTSNLTALPMISGLLAQGMNPAAALAFLIAGPTTTLPAMAAVWGLTTRRVFGLYVSFSLLGALVFGYVYYIFAGF